MERKEEKRRPRRLSVVPVRRGGTPRPPRHGKAHRTETSLQRRLSVSHNALLAGPRSIHPATSAWAKRIHAT